MRILLINPRHSSIGSRIPDDHLPPLGLLSIGGPLIDDGHHVTLLDADRENLTPRQILDRVLAHEPDAVLVGHSGSTSGHPDAARIMRMIRRARPIAWIVYGGVFPTYHWREVLAQELSVDVIVRGEGEDTAVHLMRALRDMTPLDAVKGIAYRAIGEPVMTAPAATIQMDDFRIAWELIDHRHYSYWSGKRAVVVQFSRGCPHPCNYCGQRGFWTRWRHRDPVRFAAEIAWLHREHGVEVFNFADENPTSSRAQWRAFCEALIAQDVKVLLVGSTRADDIVRDADLLHLYKKAGAIRFLMGMENTDTQTLELIRKGGSVSKDREAIRLLREHRIISMATWVVGFEEETHADYWRGFRTLVSYDPDQIQMLYVTPHRWTPFFSMAKDRRVIQTHQRRWDYKHQVLATRHMPPWLTILWVKMIEVLVQTRPRALLRLFYADPERRHAQRWYSRMGRRVWFFELKNFLFRDRYKDRGLTLQQYWGAPQEHEEEALAVRRRNHLSTMRPRQRPPARPVPLAELPRP